jgi:nucleoid-associated protein YgaU
VGRSAGIVLAREYISILATSKRATDPGAREALDKQSRELADAQLLVARLTDAQGLITVRQGHSLSSIAAFFYRNRNRWRDILQSNEHVIDNPDRLAPGLVLVLP